MVDKGRRLAMQTAFFAALGYALSPRKALAKTFSGVTDHFKFNPYFLTSDRRVPAISQFGVNLCFNNATLKELSTEADKAKYAGKVLPIVACQPRDTTQRWGKDITLHFDDTYIFTLDDTCIFDDIVAEKDAAGNVIFKNNGHRKDENGNPIRGLWLSSDYHENSADGSGKKREIARGGNKGRGFLDPSGKHYSYNNVNFAKYDDPREAFKEHRIWKGEKEHWLFSVGNDPQLYLTLHNQAKAKQHKSNSFPYDFYVVRFDWKQGIPVIERTYEGLSIVAEVFSPRRPVDKAELELLIETTKVTEDKKGKKQGTAYYRTLVSPSAPSAGMTPLNFE